MKLLKHLGIFMMTGIFCIQVSYSALNNTDHIIASVRQVHDLNHSIKTLTINNKKLERSIENLSN